MSTLTSFVSSCSSLPNAKSHYVEVNDEDPTSFCAKAQNDFARNLEGGKTEIIKGEVKSGESFEKKTSNGLLFQVKPMKDGWVIGISSPQKEDPDYLTVATPPYHFGNGRFVNLESGKGSAKDAMDWNPRSFCFVLTADDYAKAHGASQLVISPFKGGQTIEEQDAAYHGALNTLSAIKYGVGWFSITDNAIHSGDTESLDSMKFEVELRTP